MKTFKFIILAFATISIFNALPLHAETTPMTDLTPAKQIYPPFLIFDEGNGNVICTTEEGIKDGMTFETKDGMYTVRGNGILGPNGWYNIRSSDISSPSGKWYSWDEDEVGSYKKIWANNIRGSEGTFVIDRKFVTSPKNTWSGCIAR